MRDSLKRFRGFWLWLGLLCTAPAFCQTHSALPPALGHAECHSSIERYLVEYDVDAHAKSSVCRRVEVLLKSRAAVDQWSQVRVQFSEKMESLAILEAYTLTPAGKRIDVPANRIYTQESAGSAHAPLYADHKVKVMVFPALQPGCRIVFRYRLAQHTPSFPGYFDLWEIFNAFQQYDNAVVRLTAPASLPMTVHAHHVQGGKLPDTGDGRARWAWQHQQTALSPQPFQGTTWEFSPHIMASTYAGYKEIGRAYHTAAAQAARVTPTVQALADSITQGIPDRAGQAKAIHQWVVEHIRYVAVYLDNGGLTPNQADDILRNHYGDCKDYTVVLSALLAAKGIMSTPALLGVNLGMGLPAVAVLGRFNHAILYVPEFDLYLDGTLRYARFGQLNNKLLSLPVLHTVDGKITRMPKHSVQTVHTRMEMHLKFAQNGDLAGRIVPDMSMGEEMFLRQMVASETGQELQQRAQDLLAAAGYIGSARYLVEGAPDNLYQPFQIKFHFEAPDYVDFDMAGGMALPPSPAYSSMRAFSSGTSAPSSQIPFPCAESLYEERYVMVFPEGIPIVSIPRDYAFSNPAGSYQVQWRREGSVVTAVHRLKHEAVRGAERLCRPDDYAWFRTLYDNVRKGFRAQVIYGQLAS